MTSEDIQNSLWNFLKSKGLPDKSISAVFGNISQESSWDVTEIESGTGIGFGLCQWSYERRTQLEAYGTDLSHQQEFLWSELTGQNTAITGASKQWIDKQGYLSYNDFMSGNGDINSLTSAFCFCWERPNASEANLQYRQEQANYFFTKFNGQNPPNPPPDPTTSIKLKNHTLYGSDSLLPRKFIPQSEVFTLVSALGNYSIIKCNNITYKIPTKNIIK